MMGYRPPMLEDRDCQAAIADVRSNPGETGEYKIAEKYEQGKCARYRRNENEPTTVNNRSAVGNNRNSGHFNYRAWSGCLPITRPARRLWHDSSEPF